MVWLTIRVLAARKVALIHQMSAALISLQRNQPLSLEWPLVAPKWWTFIELEPSVCLEKLETQGNLVLPITGWGCSE